ncbi:MAG: hypothetical protein OXR66_06120 [Candidatus Woesearchaeota archaeon]|nr:hypothetical protein [Candidatus Woesearchaeota archaeon]
MSELVHLRLAKKTRENIKKVVHLNQFATESEFIRDAIRKSLETYQKIELLKSLRHSAPRGGEEKPTLDVFREFGIEE